MPALLEHEVTAVYVGLRAATEHVDYQVSIHADEGYACAAGFARPGSPPRWRLPSTCASSSARRACASSPRAAVPPEPSMPNIGEAFPRPYADGAAIEKDPEYGRIVCFANGSRAGSCATRSARRWRPPISTGCAAARAPVWVAARVLLRRRAGRAAGGADAVSAPVVIVGAGPARALGRDRAAPARRPGRAGTRAGERGGRHLRGTRATRASGCVTCTEQCPVRATRAG